MAMTENMSVLDAVESYMKRLSIIERAQALLEAPKRLESINQVIAISQRCKKMLDQMCFDVSKMADVPLVSVTLIDTNNQTYLAAVGLDPTSVEHRDRSFCVFVAATGQEFDMNNLNEAELLACFAYTDREIRAYLGAPIKFQDQTVGAFCVVDYKPREWSQYVHELVTMYASQVTKILEQEYENARSGTGNV